MGEKKLVTIQGKDFEDAYRTGYDQGKAWFKEDYPKTLLANNAKSYIADLHNLCYHMPLGGYTDGLAGYKDIWANPITHKWVKRVGFYSGAIAEIEQLTALHKFLISDLEECRHSTNGDQEGSTNPNQTTKGEPKKEAPKTYEPPLIMVLKQDQIFKTLEGYIDYEQHETFKQALTGQKIEGRIWVKVQSNKLVDVFKRTVTPDSDRQLAYWLSQYFEFGRNRKNVSFDSAIDVLRGKENVLRDNQLPI